MPSHGLNGYRRPSTYPLAATSRAAPVLTILTYAPSAILFDPHDEETFVRALDRLAQKSEAFHHIARNQVPNLHIRRWHDVAREFGDLLERLYPGC
jgi:hypothetical protein